MSKFDPKDAEAQFRALRGELLGDITSSSDRKASVWSTVAMVGVGITAAAATAAGVHYFLNRSSAGKGETEEDVPTSGGKKKKRKKKKKKKKKERGVATENGFAATSQAAGSEKARPHLSQYRRLRSLACPLWAKSQVHKGNSSSSSTSSPTCTQPSRVLPCA